MLEPLLCGPRLRWAPLIPKLRGHFAEFLNNASPVGLRILSSSTCVGLRYGLYIRNSGFSWQSYLVLHYFSSFPLAGPGFPFPAHSFCLRPHSSDMHKCRNINLLSIDYALRPRLRSRLPQGRSALPWNPWIFGLEDSHLHLATHSGILSSKRSAAPSGTVSSPFRMLPYRSDVPVDTSNPQASVSCFSPGNFRRRTSRLVSYYALFECVAASEPTS